MFLHQFFLIFSEDFCLLIIIEEWKKYQKNGSCGDLLTNFPKVFDCLPHSLLVAKLHAYGFVKKL